MIGTHDRPDGRVNLLRVQGSIEIGLDKVRYQDLVTPYLLLVGFWENDHESQAANNSV